MQDNDDRALVSIPEACRILNLGRSTTYKLFNSNDLVTVKVGRRRLVLKSSIDEFVRRLSEPEGAMT